MDLYLTFGMTPKEYIIETLEAQDGRLKQQDIIEYTGWSPSAVSRTLSSMEADGRIARLQLGRGKIVYLPDEFPVVV